MIRIPNDEDAKSRELLLAAIDTELRIRVMTHSPLVASLLTHRNRVARLLGMPSKKLEQF